MNFYQQDCQKAKERFDKEIVDSTEAELKMCDNCGKVIKGGWTNCGDRYWHLTCEPFCKTTTWAELKKLERGE